MGSQEDNEKGTFFKQASGCMSRHEYISSKLMRSQTKTTRNSGGFYFFAKDGLRIRLRIPLGIN
jgi:hypothetical protein